MGGPIVTQGGHSPPGSTHKPTSITAKNCYNFISGLPEALTLETPSIKRYIDVSHENNFMNLCKSSAVHVPVNNVFPWQL